jgi:hypothetical protein
MTAQQDRIEALRAAVARLSLAQVTSFATTVMIPDARKAIELFQLSSPLREVFYLLATGLSLPEPPRAADDAALNDIPQLLEEVTAEYMRRYFIGPNDKELDVAAKSYIQRYMAGRFRYVEQTAARIRGTIGPLDSELRTLLGVTSEDALTAIAWIAAKLQEDVDAATGHKTVDAIFLNPTKAQEDRAARWQRQPNCIDRGSILRALGPTLGTAYLDAFSIRRGDAEGFYWFDDLNPYERRPIVQLDEATVCVPLANQLYEALLDGASDVLASSPHSTRFYETRSAWLERTTAALFRTLFPRAFLLAPAFELPGTAEHDMVILFDRRLIVVECKSAPPARAFRDPAKAFARLKSQFSSETGIQHGFGQGQGLIDKVIAAESPIPLYDDKKREAIRLSRSDVDEAFCVIVTLEDFGQLAIDLTLLLEKGPETPYPWAVNINDLETFLTSFPRCDASSEDFIRFLRERSERQGKLQTGDELEIAGAFLKYGGLSAFPIDRPVILDSLMDSCADLFDRIYFEAHGGPAVDFTRSSNPPRFVEADSILPTPKGTSNSEKVGRNELCPCGSGKKYKRCHGRA